MTLPTFHSLCSDYTQYNAQMGRDVENEVLAKEWRVVRVALWFPGLAA